jgi:DNA-binding response OmpR family regulator
MNVLYLEDSAPDVQLIHQYMDSVNHQFRSVDSIEAARQYLRGQQPDIFLVDIVIGKEMAYDLIAEVARQKLSKHIVAVTAKALPAERKRCFDLGCDRVIAKPFTIDELETTLDQLSQE